MQTGKQVLMPLVLLDAPGGSYWREFGKFVDKQLLDNGNISPEDIHLYKITSSVDEAVDEIVDFYKVYHSMRYVRDELVIRLKEKLSEEKLAAINDQYADILTSGKFEQRDALSEEAGEPDLADLPRLVCHFDRRQLSRLRMLINEINGA